MSGRDIDKWLNGETETFFNPRETTSASADGNPRNENAPVQSCAPQIYPFRKHHLCCCPGDRYRGFSIHSDPIFARYHLTPYHYPDNHLTQP